jgi:hypothetical protein
MTLRAEYSLGHSQYNAFLFAAVGEEHAGMPVTVLTALTRLGLDAWAEAARLSDLSREAAIRDLGKTLASEELAARLIAALPERSAPDVPAVKSPGSTNWMMWSVVAFAVLLLLFVVSRFV